MEQQGIKQIDIVSSMSPLKKADPNSEYQYYQDRVDSLAKVFVDHVAKNRNISYNDVIKNYGNGGLVVAKEAMKRGMIDNIESSYRYGGYSMSDNENIASEDDAIVKLKEENNALKVEVANLSNQLASAISQERDRVIKLLDITTDKSVLANAIASGKQAEVLAYEMIKNGTYSFPPAYNASHNQTAPQVQYQPPKEAMTTRDLWNNALADAVKRRNANGS
jgi:ClpP class serine protease